MKKISRFLLLSIFLASCANTVRPIPNVTVTFKVTVTSAPTKTRAPTITPEPTSTPDPMENAPVWATGWDADKKEYYKLGADNETKYYDSGIKNKAGEAIWVENKTIDTVRLIPALALTEQYKDFNQTPWVPITFFEQISDVDLGMPNLAILSMDLIMAHCPFLSPPQQVSGRYDSKISSSVLFR